MGQGGGGRFRAEREPPRGPSCASNLHPFRIAVPLQPPPKNRGLFFCAQHPSSLR